MSEHGSWSFGLDNDHENEPQFSTCNHSRSRWSLLKTWFKLPPVTTQDRDVFKFLFEQDHESEPKFATRNHVGPC